MAAKRRKRRSSFVCPHCGADVPVGAPACRHCGSDAETGWSEDADKWEADIPTGFAPEEEDFDYDEFVEQEFPQHATPSRAGLAQKWAWLIIVAIVCLALLRYLAW